MKTKENITTNIFSMAMLLATFVRVIYSGWLMPLILFPMRGDGIRGIFSGVNGYFLPNQLRLIDNTMMILNHPYVSVTFYYSIFHPICATGFLGVALILATHISMICIILLSLGIFNVVEYRNAFLLLMIIVIFNWAPFYDGVIQGFPPEFLEVLSVVLGFYLFMNKRPALSGIALGLASTVKVMPFIFVVYFIYKKKYKVVIAALATCIILGLAILWRENFSLNLMNPIINAMGNNNAFARNTNDSGLGAFIYFVFHLSLSPQILIRLHYVTYVLLALFFVTVERSIYTEKNKYLFCLAAMSLMIFHISPHVAEIYWYILIVPTLIFNIWLLVKYRDRFFILIFTLSYLFMHGFSLLNIVFKFLRHFLAVNSIYIDPYAYFNEHGGNFIGIWLIYFSTYGMALKYLTFSGITRDEKNS